MELKSWQREAGKIALKENERAFVVNDGRIIANDTSNKDYQEYRETRIKEKREKHQERIELRLERQETRIENRVKRDEDLKRKKEERKKNKLLSKQAKIIEEQKTHENELLVIKAQLEMQ